jgi:type VI secretion system VasD/TssJ family lipoprotein
MNRRRRLLSWSTLLPALLLSSAALRTGAQTQAPPSGRQRRLALVIGNGQYTQAPLPNPENDARLVSATMKGLGFEVDVHYNLKTREFKRVLREFARRMEDDSSALVFFYAGHGMQIERRNYLLPVDLNLRDEGEVRDEAIDFEDALLSRIDRVRPRARIFIIDACRDNPFSDRTRGLRVSAGLAEMAAPGALIAFSAAPGRAAEDGPQGGNSIYSRVLAQEMKTEGIEVEEMLKNVRVKVLRETQERQIPWVNTSMVVNFVFNPASALGYLPPGQPEPAVRNEALAGGRSLRLSIQAERVLNTDKQQGSASLAIRVYVLRDDQAFLRASFDNLYDNDEKALGAAMLKREALHLRPGESRELTLPIGPEARLVAVFAAYREIERSQWRAVLALPPDGVVPPLRMAAQARQVQLTWTP